MRVVAAVVSMLSLVLAGCGDDAAADGGSGAGGAAGVGGPVFAGTGGAAGAAGMGTGGTGGIVTATGGVGGVGGVGGATGGAGGATGGTGGIPNPEGGNGGTGGNIEDLEDFSFFVTSLEVMRELSGSQDGFGGDFGGLEGADSICQQAAEKVGFGAKTWRAFLSATDDGTGNPVHAKDRVGDGPWYDRNGRLIADNLAGLLMQRPDGDSQTVDDLPNEFGEGLKQMGDTHDVLTGTNAQGMLDSPELANTCNDWTSVDAEPIAEGFPFPTTGLRVGHAWPANSGMNWMTAHVASSCKPGVNLMQNGPGDGSSVGAGGGWGGIYCFALQP